MMEIKPEDCSGMSDESKFKYRNDSNFPGSIKSKLSNLRMIPFFISLKLDLINSFQVSNQVNLTLKINISLSIRIAIGTESVYISRNKS